MASSPRRPTSPTPRSSTPPASARIGFRPGDSCQHRHRPGGRRGGPPLPESSISSATMWSQRHPPLLDETRITAWGPAFAATAASVAAVAAEIGREVGEGDVEPWTGFIAERAQFPPAVINAQRAMMTFRHDVAAW